MAQVKARSDESLDSLLRRFKRLVLKEKILTDYKQRERFEPQSEVRKRKKAQKRQKIAKFTRSDE